MTGPTLQTDSVTVYCAVYCADYLDTLGTVPSHGAALVLTDPPYGISYQNNFTGSKHEILTNDEGPFSYGALARESMRVLAPGGVLLAYTGWSTYGDHCTQISRHGFQLREPLIIQKRASGTAGLGTDFQSNSDWIIYASSGSPRFRPTELVRNKRAGTVPNPGRKPVPEWKTRFPSCWFGFEYPRSTANPSTQKRYRHPTPKDPTCAEYLIRILTDPGDLVVDPFSGSGPIAEAAIRSGRRFIGGDVLPEFAEMTADRCRATSL